MTIEAPLPIEEQEESTLLDVAPAAAHSLTEQIRIARLVCERAAQGDLEARVMDFKEGSEFGALAHAINHMLDIADAYVREASAAMHECAADRFHRPILLRGLPGAYRESAAVINRAGVRMLENSRRLGATAQLAADTASNVSMVAAACEELNSSNGEVSRQAEASARQTDNAVREAAQVTAAVKDVTSAAQKIENIATLINRIASQTNLLALNATIEAARAGEHGAGFAVVAGEVKELARSCADATKNIARQIDTMRGTVTQVVKLMDSVTVTVQNLNQNASHIASSVKEQFQATDEISRNITQVSQRMTEISSNIKTVPTR